jgi:hypothetical protein
MHWKNISLPSRHYQNVLTALRCHTAALVYSAAWLVLVVGCILYASLIVEWAVILAIKL